jgi:hypothetical protein
MSKQDNAKYFDLHLTGVAYLNRIRLVTPKEGEPFLSVTLAALRGSVDNVLYTHLECRVSGTEAQHIVRQLQPAVEDKLRVLVGFRASDLFAERFTHKNGSKAGQIGVSLKARLLRIGWAKVEGQPFLIEQAA